MTNREDVHARAVAAGLWCKGVRTTLWHTADFPIHQTASLELGRGAGPVEVLGLGPTVFASTIWLRRPKPPTLPADLADEDRAFALLESRVFLNSLYRNLGAKSFWVNPPQSWGRADLKPEQLVAAEKAGFRIPHTLVSNDPSRLRDFLRRNGGLVIFKSLSPATWNEASCVSILFGTVLRAADIPDDETLQATPGIFQERISKAYELRVTAIGRRLFAVKIRSQEVPSAEVDWRAATEAVPLEPVELPEEIAAACRSVMADLGIVFGCFDLIVSPSGDYVFLEVNEAGAFLWLEERLPELHLLDAFCEFLRQGTIAFEWGASTGHVRLEDVADEISRTLEQAAVSS